ncbi:MAG: acetate--CoA ligase family protein [Sterolibacterium sp.]
MAMEHLTEVEAKDLVQKAGIPVVETVLARSKAEAEAVARRLGFPVVLKVVSPEVVHKSDAGGVKLNVKSDIEVSQAYDEIMTSVKEKQPSANVIGVSVQKMARPGVEVIIGMSKDPDFGPVLMFGLGGVLVELIKDVSFRIAPITRQDAAEMIREIKGFALLQGYRGADPVDLTALEDMLLKVSALVDQNPDVNEMDLNPVFAYRDGAIAVDARVALEAK